MTGGGETGPSPRVAAWGRTAGVALAVLALLGRPTPAQESREPRGPLDLWPQSPLHDLRLGHVPRPVKTLPAGGRRISWSETWVNIWNQRRGDLQVDYETLETVVALGVGLGEGFEVELFFRQRNRFRGVLDSMIEAWHDLFGLSQNGRDDFPGDDVVIEIPAQGPDPAVSSDVIGTLNEDLGLRLQHGFEPFGRGGPRLGWATSVLWHTGGDSELAGPRDVDFGLTLLGGQTLAANLHAQVDLSYHWLGSNEFAGLALEPRNLSVFAALEWTAGNRTSVVLQYLWMDHVARSRYPYDEAAHELGIGVRHEVASGTWLEFALIENAFRIDNSPDFGLHLGLRVLGSGG